MRWILPIVASFVLTGSRIAAEPDERQVDEAVATPRSSTSCTVVGTTPAPADTPIFDARKGGHRIAELTGEPEPLPERKLTLQDPPEILTATAQMPIHRNPENSPSGIGIVEVGARFYAMEQSGEWTNIMPESLAVLPPDDGGFWVRTASLP